MGAQLSTVLDTLYDNPQTEKLVYIKEDHSKTRIFEVHNNPGSLISLAQLTVRRAGTGGATIGTATFHPFSSNIELNINDSPQTMKRRLFSQSYRLQSSGGALLKWKVKRFPYRLKLVDVKSGEKIGEIRHLSFGRKKTWYAKD